MKRTIKVPDELSQIDQIDEEAASVASSSMETITTIPITQLDKYVVTCEINGSVDFRQIQHLAQQLDQWWRGDNKFFVLAQNNDMSKIRFERIEKDNEL